MSERASRAVLSSPMNMYSEVDQVNVTKPLSLYSTVTRKHSRWTIPITQEFCIDMLVSKNSRISVTHNPNSNICVTPNANPQREQVQYRSHLGSQRKILALAMYISCCLCHFHLHWVANANTISSGKWALIYLISFIWK